MQYFQEKLVTMDSFRIFGGIFFAHPLPEVLTKHNIKENDSQGNTWIPFYMSKGEGLGDG